MRVIGLDPGLRNTGWGVIEVEGSRLSYIASGVVRPPAGDDLAARLVVLKKGLEDIFVRFQPQAAAVEVTLANKNPDSTLKLGMARGIALLVPAEAGLNVAEYLPMIVKKSVVGTGHAAKEQVQAMICQLLPGAKVTAADAADALAVAICHAHNLQTGERWSRGRADPLAARTLGTRS